MPVRRFVLSVLCVSAALLSACLERYESITINPDGSAQLRSEFRGTPEDFKKTADALPDQNGGWAITERQEKDKDGKPRTIRIAELTITPGAAIPDCYATQADPRRASALRFPSTFKTIHTDGGTRFEFSRKYEARDEAAYSYLRKRLTENDQFKAIQSKDPSTLTPEQRATLLHTFAHLEGDKNARYIEVGARALVADGTWPQHIPLLLRAAALNFADGFDIAKADALLRQPESPERDAQLNTIAGEFSSGIGAAIKAEFSRLNVPEAQQARFERIATAERNMRAATEDLADERWEVRLTMPGTLLAHNADRVENNVLIWEFSADAFMDRDNAIRASSLVPATK